MSAVLLAAAVGGNRELAPERQQCGRDRELEDCRPPTATAAKQHLTPSIPDCFQGPRHA